MTHSEGDQTGVTGDQIREHKGEFCDLKGIAMPTVSTACSEIGQED